MEKLIVFYSPEYCVQGSSFETLQKSAWIATSLERRPISGVELRAPRPLELEDLLAVHTERYVEAIRTGI